MTGHFGTPMLRLRSNSWRRNLGDGMEQARLNV
jgi:hypothetical protein